MDTKLDSVSITFQRISLFNLAILEIRDPRGQLKFCLATPPGPASKLKCRLSTASLRYSASLISETVSKTSASFSTSFKGKDDVDVYMFNKITMMNRQIKTIQKNLNTCYIDNDNVYV